jgi:hypothetical protein
MEDDIYNQGLNPIDPGAPVITGHVSADNSESYNQGLNSDTTPSEQVPPKEENKPFNTWHALKYMGQEAGKNTVDLAGIPGTLRDVAKGAAIALNPDMDENQKFGYGIDKWKNINDYNNLYSQYSNLKPQNTAERILGNIGAGAPATLASVLMGGDPIPAVGSTVASSVAGELAKPYLNGLGQMAVGTLAGGLTGIRNPRTLFQDFGNWRTAMKGLAGQEIGHFLGGAIGHPHFIGGAMATVPYISPLINALKQPSIAKGAALGAFPYIRALQQPQQEDNQ